MALNKLTRALLSSESRLCLTYLLALTYSWNRSNFEFYRFCFRIKNIQYGICVLRGFYRNVILYTIHRPPNVVKAISPRYVYTFFFPELSYLTRSVAAKDYTPNYRFQAFPNTDRSVYIRPEGVTVVWSSCAPSIVGNPRGFPFRARLVEKFQNKIHNRVRNIDSGNDV